MMSANMKEPWYVFSHYGDPEIRTKDGDKLVAALLPSKLKTARRIVACVNACAGIATEVLEAAKDGAALIDLIESAVRLTKQRDDLLAEFAAYKEGSEEAFVTIVEQKKALESRVVELQRTINTQKDVILDFRKRLAKAEQRQ